MGRPRSFAADEVVDTAMDLFWGRGYQASAVADLEDATGLSRSSLYQAFGSKEALFDSALDRYIGSVVDDLLGGMERPGATVDDVARFFRRLARTFRGDGALARRGCLWVNSILELAGAPDAADPRGAEYTARLRTAFTYALARPGRSGAVSRPSVERRARMLAAATLGAWIMVRVDRRSAARLCSALAAEVKGWATPAVR
jgi:TetR/AcrR family transcriptional regulator, transcriptional repressor for nem operon